MKHTTDLPAYHCEVLQRLKEGAEPDRAAAVQADRNSELEYLGIRAPVLRQAVKQEFSFYSLPHEETLAVWDFIWKTSPYAEVMYAAVEYYELQSKKVIHPELWPVVRHWSERIENWAHADGLGVLYSRILERQHDEVYPQLVRWNKGDALWPRRLSLVSLIHYTGKNAVFLPPDAVLPLVENCLDDTRPYIQKAVGWVLREMDRAYPLEIGDFIKENIKALSGTAFSRAIDRRDKAQKSALRQMRKEAIGRT